MLLKKNSVIRKKDMEKCKKNKPTLLDKTLWLKLVLEPWRLYM